MKRPIILKNENHTEIKINQIIYFQKNSYKLIFFPFLKKSVY